MKVKLGLGVATLPVTEPASFWRWVDRCEDSACDSLWQTDRLISKQAFLEPLSTMAALAGRTTRMKFGMNAVVASLRDPLVLAKQCATIDYLSGGRLLPVFGVGGKIAPEWKATGRSPAGRGRRADEVLEIASRLWSEESVDFEGEFYNYRGASVTPRPIQQPLPLWIGGSSAAAIRRTARLGTGWLAGIQTPSQIAPVVQAIQIGAKDFGRNISDDHFGAGIPFRFGSANDPIVTRAMKARARVAESDFDPREYLAVGDADDVLERIEAYRAVGISKFVMIPMARDEEDLMLQTGRLLEDVLPIAHAWT